MADAYVDKTFPTQNFGSSEQLIADKPQQESFLLFDVAELGGAIIVGAKLRLYTTGTTVDGPQVYAAGTDWTESGITWSTRPVFLGELDNKGAISPGWVEYDLRFAVTGEGTYAFALVPTSSDGISFYSREKGSFAPELVLTVAGLNQPPAVNAGADQAITLAEAANLAGVVSDDGQASSPGAVTTTWSMVEGPGTVTFADPSVPATSATFSAPAGVVSSVAVRA